MKTYEHGTNTNYVHGGCRCDTCRQAHREYSQRYRAIKYKQGYKNSKGVLVAPEPQKENASA